MTIDSKEWHCGVPLNYVEIYGVWDGALFLYCTVCKQWRHRFEPGDYRRVRGERMDAFPPPEEEMTPS